ncbi:hypothetical protein G9272_16800 [Streptomyces asoensis]|uniref:Uncharacterized protein n=1 Tax=Streptomyces asoensis TaxID=249586 RepID=A0A6M4WR36_9ACTN|nr:hypothetical protein [Streptomyces asoensis]QJT01765.1 hypothetical protein G9272_16800 [Streptomyces asoensis]
MTRSTSRVAVIARVLRGERPVRQLLACELRGQVVQLLGYGTTDPTWTATPELLAEAIDAGLTRAEREEKDTPAGAPSTAHALVLEADGLDLVGVCQCGRRIGRAPLARSVDGLVGLWQRHTDQADRDAAAWADALTALPNTRPIGAS